MSNLLTRILIPGAYVTLHTTQPGPVGGMELGRSGLVQGPLWRALGQDAVNAEQIVVPIRAWGIATHVAIWVEGRMRMSGRLRESKQVEPGDEPYFDRVALRLRDG